MGPRACPSNQFGLIPAVGRSRFGPSMTIAEGDLVEAQFAMSLGLEHWQVQATLPASSFCAGAAGYRERLKSISGWSR